MMLPRIGVLACSCWTRSESGVDADAIVEHALGLPGVVHAEATDDLCGRGRADLAGELVVRHSLDRLVVAACACCPQDQRCPACNPERAALRESVKERTGLPWSHHAFVNVRDHGKATSQALTLVSMAVARLARTPALVPPRTQRSPVRAVLIVGGGARGRAAALDLVERGVPVHLADQASLASSPEGTPEGLFVHAPAVVESLSGGGGSFDVRLSELGSSTTLEVGAVLVAPGLVEERREASVGWGLPHRTMAQPPTRVSGMFLAQDDPVASAAAVDAHLSRSLLSPEAVATVDPGQCIGCMKCTRVCPYSAIKPVAGRDDLVEVDPLLCAGCGACPSACMNWAIETTGYTTPELEAALRAGLERTRALLVVCNWSAYRAYDEAATGDLLPPSLAVLRLPCTARLSPHLVSVALDLGADPIIVAGCSEEGCHFRGRRGVMEENVRHLSPGLSASGDLGRVQLVALGARDHELLAVRVEEALHQRELAREERELAEEGEVGRPSSQGAHR